MKPDIRIIKGDITTIHVEAIVNAANSSLLGGGGVDGAIHRKGGPAILEACRKIRNRQGKCNTGEAVYTKAGMLPAQYVIHTVGPVWQNGTHHEDELLASCYRNSLLIANELELKTIAFPNISTGVYGYPKKEACIVALETISSFLKSENKTIEEVLCVCYDEENYQLYNAWLKQPE